MGRTLQGLGGDPWHLVVCSPYKRCVDTAALIALVAEERSDPRAGATLEGTLHREVSPQKCPEVPHEACMVHKTQRKPGYPETSSEANPNPRDLTIAPAVLDRCLRRGEVLNIPILVDLEFGEVFSERYLPRGPRLMVECAAELPETHALGERELSQPLLSDVNVGKGKDVISGLDSLCTAVGSSFKTYVGENERN